MRRDIVEHNQEELNKMAKEYLEEYLRESKLSFVPLTLFTEKDLLYAATKLRIAKGCGQLSPEYYFLLQYVSDMCSRLGIEQEDMLFGLI